MAAYTSSQAGNWSNSATWGGAGVPGNGDTATVNHAVTVDANTIVGTSGAAGTAVVTLGAGGGVTIATGVAFIVRGDFTGGAAGATLVLNAGATYTFDSSLATGTPVYKITATVSNFKLTASGTSGSRCAINKAVGSGNGVIHYNFTTDFTVDLNYTDLSSLSDGTYSIYASVPSAKTLNLDHCIFTSCARVQYGGVAGGNVTYTNNSHKTTVGSYCIRPYISAAATGSRTFTGNIFDKQFLSDQNTHGFTIENNYFGDVVTLTGGTTISFKNNITASNAANIVSLNALGTYQDNYFVASVASNPHYFVINNPPAGGTFTFDGNIYESTVNTDTGDCVLPNADPFTVPVTINVIRDIVIPVPDGRASGSPLTVARRPDNLTVSLKNCTYAMGGTGSESRGAVLHEYGGSNAYGRTGIVSAFRNNIAWDSTAGRGWKAHLTGNWNADSGTSSGTNGVNTLNDTAKAWTASIWIANSSTFRVRITGGTGSGQVRTITANTATQLTVDTNWTVTPDATSTYIIFLINEFATNPDYNCGFNHTQGNIYDETGVLASASGNGYDKYAITGGVVPGAHDVNADPQFADSARNIAKWDLSLGGPGTSANALTELQKRNDISGYNSAYTELALSAYVKNGFAPKNTALKGAGSPTDGSPDIGAVAVVALGISRGRVVNAGGFGSRGRGGLINAGGV